MHPVIEEIYRTAPDLCASAIWPVEGQFDFGYIDGFHTFDHTMIDLFYVSGMIRVGAFIAADDVNMPAVNRAGELDTISMVAFQKVEEDRRNHSWYDYI